MSAPTPSSDVKVISLQYLTGGQGTGKVKAVPRLYMKPAQHSSQNKSSTISTAPIFLQQVSQTYPSVQTTGYINTCSMTNQVQSGYYLTTANPQTSYLNTGFKNTNNYQLYPHLNQTNSNHTNPKTAPSIIYLKPVKTGLNSTSSANKTIQLMPILPQNRDEKNIVQLGSADSSSASNKEIVLAELKVPVVKTGYPLPNQTIQSTYLPRAGYQLPNQTIQSVNLPKIVYQLPSQTIQSGYLPIGGYPLPSQTIQSGYLPNQPMFNGVQFTTLPVKADLPVASTGNSSSLTAMPYYVSNKLMASEGDQEASVQGKVVALDNSKSSKGKKTKKAKIKEPKTQMSKPKTTKMLRSSTRKITPSKKKIESRMVSPKSYKKKVTEAFRRTGRPTRRTISSVYSNSQELLDNEVSTERRTGHETEVSVSGTGLTGPVTEVSGSETVKSLEDNITRSSTKRILSGEDEGSVPLVLEGLNSVNYEILPDYGDKLQIVSEIMAHNEHSVRPQHEFKRIKLNEEYPRLSKFSREPNNRKRDCLIGGDLTNSNLFSNCDLANTEKRISLTGQSQAVPEVGMIGEDKAEQEGFYSHEINDNYMLEFYDNDLYLEPVE